MAARPPSEEPQAQPTRLSPVTAAHPPTLHSPSSARSPPTSSHGLRPPPSPKMEGHRRSFAENLRTNPTSPRAQRHNSFSERTLQELLSNPPIAKNGASQFQGRDWRGIEIGEIIDPEHVRFVDMDMSVEQATKALVQAGPPNVVLLRESPTSRRAIGTFDYGDLTAYLLLVIGLAHPGAEQADSFQDLAQRGREGKPIPMKDVKDLGNKKDPLHALPHTAHLSEAVELFGSGIHYILIVKEHTTDVIGILTQLRLLRFFWENGKIFASIDHLYHQTLNDLQIGTHSVFSINGDKPLTDALELMANEGITSLPVLDNQKNVIGNISQVDVRLLTKTTSLPLLRSSCIHFISVILSERGMNDGKDSFPVFHVSPYSTLAHTVAKLVATRSHRMWVVDAPSPMSSGPPTPSATHAPTVPPLNIGSPSTPLNHGTQPAMSISASQMPGATLSGRLSGVVSLTDILNLFARKSGLRPHDPDETRRHRRRSSSSSMRKSMDSTRSSSVDVFANVSRSGSLRAPQ